MLRRSFLLMSLTVTFASVGQAGQPQTFTGIVEGVGAGGYDVVSYFSKMPVPGKKIYTATWKGAEWRFSSAENLKAFEAAPEKYAPQYGGYCAYGLAQGYAVKGEPEQWSVVDGKLYLNYSASVKSKWQTDIPGYIKTGDANWPKVLE
jgi:YHS domain-containing protein